MEEGHSREREFGHALLQPVMKVLAYIGAVALLLMMLHVTADVIGRVIFNHPLDGTTEIVSAYYMVSVIFLPLAYVTYYEGHILVELFTRKLSPRALATLEFVIGIVTTALLMWLIWETYVAAMKAYAIREKWQSGDELLTIWPSKWVLPIGLTAMAAYQISVIITRARTAFGHMRGTGDRV